MKRTSNKVYLKSDTETKYRSMKNFALNYE